ncbi:MAG: AraC family transcriptional regulator [Spirosoma sp.]|nr:AraC family transcriptional regulator [Spirosoma sp.]
MIYCTITPSTHLQSFVESYTLAHFLFDKSVPGPIKPFPVNPQQCLVFYLRGGLTAFHSTKGTSLRFPQIAVNGAQLSRFDFHISHEFLMLSVNFQPGCLSKFLQMPLADEFIDDRIDAEALLSPEVHQLHERLANAPRYENIIPLLETYLWQRISRLKTEFHPIDQVCRIIAQRPALFSLDELAGQACLSASQFERRFTQQIGISPKLFARINRFYKAYQLKDQNPLLDWLSIALQTGYTDYQHLVKDFKQFAGATPNSLLLAQASSPERILGIG